jgi:arylsulfate sulfotransferase
MTRKRKNARSNDRSALTFFLIPLTFTLLMISGCGSQIIALAPPIPHQPAPSGPPPSASQSGAVSLSPRYVALGQGSSLQFRAAVTSNASVEWLVNGVSGGNATVGTIDAKGKYLAPAALTQSTNVVVTAEIPGSAQTDFATSVVSLIQPGVITATLNPQVVVYSIYLPAPGTAQIGFSPPNGHQLDTWSQPTPSPYGGMISIEVAGMQAQTLYHMQAQVTLDDSATFQDADHTFTAGTPPATAPVVVSAPNGSAPQPGIELFETTQPVEPAQAFATDLAGNVIWTYNYSGPTLDFVQPIKLLQNGHFLVQISYASSAQLHRIPVPATTYDEIREIDLAGNTIRSLTLDQLAASLSAQGYDLNLRSFHHDVLPLPNGHTVLLVSLTQIVSLPGNSGTSVLGDVLVDVDQNFKPDWVWNSFDHLNVTRHPYLFPDWTHSNALLYSADDRNLLLSVRHQNWIIKIDFNDGKGSGNILWRLGEGGDFKLAGGVDPTDWFYAQHGPSYFSPNTTGTFALGIMDNGDDRIFSSGTTCGASGAPPCLYSTAEVLQIDESRRQATLVSDYTPGSIYSLYGGNVDYLANRDFVVDFCAAANGSLIQEVNRATQQVVWQATTPKSNQYRADRLPSLYPGVQW